MIRIVALTDSGHQLANRLAQMIPGSAVWFKPQPFAEQIQQAFQAGDRLLLICATGIVVRTLAPVISDKYSDPAVLVLDEAGQFVIPLLSGHEGGANDWGAEVAQKIGAQLVLTTANSYLRPVYTVGMGCERNCSLEDLNDLLQDCLRQTELLPTAVRSLNSIDIKHDEIGLQTLARQLQWPYQTWAVADLSQVQDKLQTPSDYVFETVGVYGVAESAALFAAQKVTGNPAELVLPKQKNAKATCAIARSYPAHELRV